MENQKFNTNLDKESFDYFFENNQIVNYKNMNSGCNNIIYILAVLSGVIGLIGLSIIISLLRSGEFWMSGIIMMFSIVPILPAMFLVPIGILTYRSSKKSMNENKKIDYIVSIKDGVIETKKVRYFINKDGGNERHEVKSESMVLSEVKDLRKFYGNLHIIKSSSEEITIPFWFKDTENLQRLLKTLTGIELEEIK